MPATTSRSGVATRRSSVAIWLAAVFASAMLYAADARAQASAPAGKFAPALVPRGVAEAVKSPAVVAAAAAQPGKAVDSEAAKAAKAKVPQRPDGRSTDSPPPQLPQPQPQPFPDLRGKTCSQSQAILAQIKLSLPSCSLGKPTGQWPPGRVNWQFPDAGTPIVRPLSPSVALETVAPEMRVVPDLRGLSCSRAASVLISLDTKLQSCLAGPSIGSYPPGVVNWQSQPKGKPLPLAAGIELRYQPEPVVAPPPPALVVVPNVIGSSRYDATATLHAAPLQGVETGPVASNGRHVIAQSPAAGSKVPARSSVQLTLGLTVPDLVGLDCAEASARSAQYGHPAVDCKSRPAPSSTEKIGLVFEQSPERGVTVPAPVAIRVVAWSAERTVVPDVRNKPLAQALAAIESARLVGKADAQGDRRVVRAQRPAAGAKVDVGSTVNLSSVELLDVPDVVRSPLSTAIASLRAAGLRAQPDATDHAPDRRVESQSPAAHSRALPNSVVRLSTQRWAEVPDVRSMSCANARDRVPPALFEWRCVDAADRWSRLLGEPVIDTQEPAASSRAVVGSMLTARAHVPTPEWVRWFTDHPARVVATMFGSTFLGVGVVAWRKRWRPVPPLKPPHPPSVRWRAVPDANPTVQLREHAIPEEPGVTTRTAARKFAWRLVPDESRVLLRELAPETGGAHGDDRCDPEDPAARPARVA